MTVIFHLSCPEREDQCRHHEKDFATNESGKENSWARARAGVEIIFSNLSLAVYNDKSGCKVFINFKQAPFTYVVARVVWAPNNYFGDT